MASKIYEPSKVSVYPDQSTISDAFRADADPAYASIRPWLSRISTEANLCLSIAHIYELSTFPDAALADDIARWIDAHPIVWLKSSFDDLPHQEAERWVKRAFGLPTELRAFAFAPSFTTAIHALTQESASELMVPDPVAHTLRELRGSDSWKAHVEGHGTELLSHMWPVRKFVDAKKAAGVTSEQIQREREANVRIQLRTEAMSAARRLADVGDLEFAGRDQSKGNAIDLLEALYGSDPRAMPLFRLRHALIAGTAEKVERSRATHGQPSKSLVQELTSAFGDQMHIVGAGYCDVFTCDARVAKWAGNVREQMAMQRQLAVRECGGPAGFVAALMATFP